MEIPNTRPGWTAAGYCLFRRRKPGAFRLRCQNGFFRSRQRYGRTGYRNGGHGLPRGTIMSILELWGLPKKDFYGWQVKNAEGFFIRLPGDWKPGKAFPAIPL